MTPDHADGLPAEKDANAVEIWAGCHKPFTKRGADGECLRCLVGFALTPDNTDG